MATKFSELYRKIPVERRARIEGQVREERRKIALSEMRRARGLARQAMGRRLEARAVYIDKTIDPNLSSQ